MVQERTFREDLFYRLNVIRIAVPALRERVEDIDELADHFLRDACRRNGLAPRTLDASARQFLRGRPWPGNVRELKNLVEAAAILAEGTSIDAKSLESVAAARLTSGPAGGDFFTLATLEEFRESIEREFIRRKLQENGGNIKRTAERIGIQRSNLYKKLERYGLK
jgi:two-component system nitrogen regulation response regulator NtrX